MKSQVIATPDAFRAELFDDGARSLFDYWQSLRGPRAMPARADIDPLEIPRNILPWLYILAVSDDGNHRFRLAGTGLDTVFNAEITGKRVDEVLEGRDLENARRSYDFVISRARPWYSSVLYRADERWEIRYSRLTLPLGPDGEKPDFLIGGLFLDQDEGMFERFSELFARGGVDPSARREVVLV